MGIIHADIKPGNVLLDGDDHPRITDWGVSRQSHGFTTAGARATTGGGFTVEYAAPEVLTGGQSTFASDMCVRVCVRARARVCV